MLKDKKIVLAVTGGIAAYKAIDLASRLKKCGAVVKTILTASALKFVSENNFRAITGERSYIDQFELEDPISHISLADWGDMLVIAPATANIIGKMAHGIGDDLVSTTLLAFHKPVLVVPAMNVNMYRNSIVQDNISYLLAKGVNFLEPEEGMLACGYVGKGKYPPNPDVIDAMKFYLHYKKSFNNCKILVSAGASQEQIDPMRFITNRSTGKMGLALAKSAFFRGALTTLIHGSLKEDVPYYLDNVEEKLSAEDMFSAITSVSHEQDVIIMCAAVADYTPDKISEQKIKKSGDLSLSLKKTKDILQYLGENKPAKQILVGFAAETENIIENGKGKLIKKNLDLLIANNINVAGDDTTEAYLITKDDVIEFKGTKFLLAQQIMEMIEKLRNAN